MFRALIVLGSCLAATSLVAVSCGTSDESVVTPVMVAGHSSSIVTSLDGKTLYVVNADLDSVSIIDVGTRALVEEILLGSAHPAADDAGAYTPAVLPRALALSPDASTLYVTGERSSMLYAIDLATSTVIHTVTVGSEPFGVLVAADGSAIFVACSQDATIVRVDAKSFTVTATTPTPNKPWSLSASPDGSQILTTHLLGPGVTSIDPTSMALRATWTIPEKPSNGDKTFAHGVVRGIYAASARPGTDEIWVAHALLGIHTAQPDLDFESTAFPSLSVLHADGTFVQTLSTSSQTAGANGALIDVVSGPRDVAFTHDGHYALMVDMDSEDLLVFDAVGRAESSLLRPLPGHMPEGVAISPDEHFAYIDERNTGDIAVVSIDRSSGKPVLAVSGAPIPRYASDPMPATIRLGQHLYYSANSFEYPLTTNNWISCATCHMEGRSDAVTWLFTPGPRDTPSTAGGVLNTGFLFRTADRRIVQDYWRTIDTEQGGSFDPATYPAAPMLLDAIAKFVNYGLPLPIRPKTDPALVAQGQKFFEDPKVGCSGCHSGPRFTDSGTKGLPNNSITDLANPILHDVGTCVTTDFEDVAHEDIDGGARAPCMFDTPSLNGVADSPPYLHDGSAATLRDVLEMTRGKMGDASPDQDDALVEYLRSL